MGRPSRRAFCEPGPDIWRPLGHGACGACTAAAGRFLGAPLAAPEQAPDAGGTIGHAQVAFKESDHPLESPAVLAPAMRARPLAEQRPQLVALRGVECGLTARMPFGGEAGLALLRSCIPPAPDRTRRCFPLACHV